MRRLFLFLTIISKSYTYKDVRTRDARKQIARLSIKRLLEEERKWTSSTFKSGHRICTRRSLYNGDGTARVKGAANASPLEINARVTGGRWLTHCPPTYPLRMGRLVKKIQMWNFHFRSGSPARKKYFLPGETDFFSKAEKLADWDRSIVAWLLLFRAAPDFSETTVIHENKNTVISSFGFQEIIYVNCFWGFRRVLLKL